MLEIPPRRAGQRTEHCSARQGGLGAKRALFYTSFPCVIREIESPSSECHLTQRGGREGGGRPDVFRFFLCSFSSLSIYFFVNVFYFYLERSLGIGLTAINVRAVARGRRRRQRDRDRTSSLPEGRQRHAAAPERTRVFGARAPATFAWLSLGRGGRAALRTRATN